MIRVHLPCQRRRATERREERAELGAEEAGSVCAAWAIILQSDTVCD